MTVSKKHSQEARDKAKAIAEAKASEATLRDEFAKAALSGLSGLVSLQHGGDYDLVGRLAYVIADAAILARDESPDESPDDKAENTETIAPG